MELRRVCQCIAVVGLRLRRDCAEGQRTPRDRADARERSLVERVVARARSCERQPVKGDGFVCGGILVAVCTCRRTECDARALARDKAREGIVRPLRERLRDVCIAVVGLVKARAAHEVERQLLRRDCPHALRLFDGIVLRICACEREILERYFLIPACVLIRILARDSTRQFDI